MRIEHAVLTCLLSFVFVVRAHAQTAIASDVDFYPLKYGARWEYAVFCLRGVATPDYLSVTRPFGPAFDIGAIEATSTPAPDRVAPAAPANLRKY